MEMVMSVISGKYRYFLAMLAALTLALTGCALGSGGTAAATQGVEKPDLTVAVVPAVDSAGFFVALYEGLFKAQGLTIHYTPAVSSDEVIDQQVAGQYDIT